MQILHFYDINMQEMEIFMDKTLVFLIFFSKFATNLINKLYGYEYVSERVC